MIVAVVAFIGALGAMPVSMVLRRLGARRALMFGLVAIGIASAIGAAASGAAVLIFSRAIEGLGLLATVLVIPDLLQQTVAPRDRDVILAIWGGYMPDRPRTLSATSWPAYCARRHSHLDECRDEFHCVRKSRR